MLWRLAMLALLGAVIACNPRTHTAEPPRAAPQEEPASVLSEQQVRERSEQCASASREAFQRDWKGAGDFAHHYNARLDTCFFLLTVESLETRSRKLFDVNERELYGEYLGPLADESPMKTSPAECRVAGFYCASGREWEVLVRNFMEG